MVVPRGWGRVCLRLSKWKKVTCWLYGVNKFWVSNTKYGALKKNVPNFMKVSKQLP